MINYLYLNRVENSSNEMHPGRNHPVSLIETGNQSTDRTVKKVLHAMHDENKVRERRGIETYKSGSLFTNYNIVILRNR